MILSPQSHCAIMNYNLNCRYCLSWLIRAWNSDQYFTKASSIFSELLLGIRETVPAMQGSLSVNRLVEHAILTWNTLIQFGDCVGVKMLVHSSNNHIWLTILLIAIDAGMKLLPMFYGSVCFPNPVNCLWETWNGIEDVEMGFCESFIRTCNFDSKHLDSVCGTCQ